MQGLTETSLRCLWLASVCTCALGCTPVNSPNAGAANGAQTDEHAASKLTDAAAASPDDNASGDAGAPGTGHRDASAAAHAGDSPTRAAEAEGSALPSGMPADKSGDGPADNSGSHSDDSSRAGAADGPAGSQAEPASAGDEGSTNDPADDDAYVPRTDPPDPNETLIPKETADNDALTRLSRWSLLPVFAAATLHEQNAQDRGNASREEIALFASLDDGNRDLSNFICKGAQSTVSTGTIAYLYDEAACREEYVRGVEMARFEGSGRMVRLWMTVTSIEPGLQLSGEWVRIYVDDNPRPITQLRLDQLVAGAADELFATPFGSGAKNSIAWHYPVVFSTKLVVALDHLTSDYFYEIDAVLDDVPQRRVGGGTRRNARDAAHARLANASPVPDDAVQLARETLALGPGDSRTITLAGPATIDEMVLRVPQDKLASLAAVRITGHWDGAASPAIDLPLLSLFASARVVPAVSSLALAASVDGSDQVLALRLPMPFEKQAAWDLVNTGDEAAELSLTWRGHPGVPSQPYGHLHVQFQEAPIPLTQIEQSIASAETRGRYVGTCADLTGRSESSVLGSTQSDPMDLARGDVRVMVDGELALQSTATDHYADNAIYFADSPKSTPFAQTWGRVQNASADPPGQISFCRWHVLGNEIDFKRSLAVSREAAQRDTSIVSLHRTVAYLYLQ